MSRNFIDRLRSRIRHALRLPKAVVHVQLIKHHLLVREGTIRITPDYDDAWLIACALHAEIIFDVGANVGYDALLALLAGKTQQVILVEANAEALSIAAENLIRNHLSTGARFVTAFADAQDDHEIEFWTVGTGAAGSIYRGHAVTAARTGQSIRVPTLTLDTLAERFGLIPNLIKIDVEGAEQRVLRGCQQCIAMQRTRLLVEMHSNPELSMLNNAISVLDWCKNTGYRAWYLAEGVLLEHPEQIAHRGRCHLLLQPAAWPYPEWLRDLPQSSALVRALAARST